MNDAIKRMTQISGLPSVLESPGLDRRVLLRSDGMKGLPFREIRSLVWNYPCVNAFVVVHLDRPAMEVGAVESSKLLRGAQAP